MRAPGIQRRIFVVGAPRSGTTLVQTLLAAHGELTSFTESHFFDRYFRRLPIGSSPVLVKSPRTRAREFLLENGVPADDVDSWLASAGLLASGPWPPPLRTSAVARQLLSLLDALARERHSSGWVEKTPRHLYYIPFLHRLSREDCPTHFVHVVRRGADVVASLYIASQHWERRYDLDTCVERWNGDLQFSLDRVGSGVDHFVFYEDLTADPEGTLRSLLRGLDLEWQPGMVEHLAETSAALITDGETWKQNLGDRVRRGATSQDRLTDEQRERINASLDRGLYERLRAAARTTSENAQGMAG